MLERSGDGRLKMPERNRRPTADSPARLTTRHTATPAEPIPPRSVRRPEDTADHRPAHHARSTAGQAGRGGRAHTAVRPARIAAILVAIAAGAMLTFAVDFSVSGVSVHPVGAIIMLAGAAALAVVLIRAPSGRRRPDDVPRRTTAGSGPRVDLNRAYFDSLREGAE